MEVSNLEICPYIRRLPSGRKCCAVMNCFCGARSRGDFCIKHGGGIRCTVANCTKGARSTAGLCIKHGGGPRCLIEGCNRGAADRCDGYCVRHFNSTLGPMRYKRKNYASASAADDDSDYRSDSTMSWRMEGHELETSKKKMKPRNRYTTTLISNSTASDVISSIGSVQSLVDDVQGVFTVTESETEINNKSELAKSNTSPTMVINPPKSETVDKANEFMVPSFIQEIIPSPMVHPTSMSSTSLSSKNQNQFLSPVQNKELTRFVNYMPITITQPQISIQRLHNSQMFVNYPSSSTKAICMNPIQHANIMLNDRNNDMVLMNAIPVQNLFNRIHYAYHDRYIPIPVAAMKPFHMKRF